MLFSSIFIIHLSLLIFSLISIKSSFFCFKEFISFCKVKQRFFCLFKFFFKSFSLFFISFNCISYSFIFCSTVLLLFLYFNNSSPNLFFSSCSFSNSFCMSSVKIFWTITLFFIFSFSNLYFV